MTVVVKKLGGSVAVVIPKAVAREMALAEGTALEISNTGDEIVMRKPSRRRRRRRPRRPIAEIVAQLKPASYRRQSRALGDDGPRGKEIW